MLLVTLTFTYLVGMSALNGTGEIQAAAQETCPDGDGWTKVDSEELSQYPVIGATQYCFKAGSDNSQGCEGGLFQSWPQGEGVCGLSHWSYYIPATPTPTNTPVPSVTVTSSPTPTVTLTPTVTNTPTVTLTPTATSTPTPTSTTEPTPTPTTEPTVTPTLTNEPTVTPTTTTEPTVTPTTTTKPTVTPTEGQILGVDTEEDPEEEGKVLAETGRALNVSIAFGALIIVALVLLNKETIERRVTVLKKAD